MPFTQILATPMQDSVDVAQIAVLRPQGPEDVGNGEPSGARAHNRDLYIGEILSLQFERIA